MAIIKLALTYAFLAGAFTSASFLVPESQADGVYIAKDLGDGTYNHTLINNVVTTDVTFPRILKRQDPGDYVISCTAGDVNPGDWQIALNGLTQACNPSAEIFAGDHVYSSYGSCIMFVCNYGGNNDCASSEIPVAYGKIGAQCLNYQSGKIRRRSRPATGRRVTDFFMIGIAQTAAWSKAYGYETAGSTIC